jgi:hypothetical protein
LYFFIHLSKTGFKSFIVNSFEIFIWLLDMSCSINATIVLFVSLSTIFSAKFTLSFLSSIPVPLFKAVKAKPYGRNWYISKLSYDTSNETIEALKIREVFLELLFSTTS